MHNHFLECILKPKNVYMAYLTFSSSRLSFYPFAQGIIITAEGECKLSSDQLLERKSL